LIVLSPGVGRYDEESPMNRIRHTLTRLAREDPSVRAVLVPLTKQADKWNKLPPGWTQESVKKFWESLTGENKHKVTKCIKQMEGKGIDDPGAFCASLADKVDPGWRSKKAEWKGWDESMPVQMVHDDAHTENFPNLAAAQKKYPRLTPERGMPGFHWAMRGSINGHPAIRFDSTGAYRELSRDASGQPDKKVVEELQRKFPDWPKGDLMDAATSVSPRMSPEAKKVQEYYQHLKRKTAATVQDFTNPKTIGLAKIIYGQLKTVSPSWGGEPDMPSKEPSGSAQQKVLSPAQGFEAGITTEIKSLAEHAWGKVKRNPAAAEALAASVAGDVNWHSLQAISPVPGIDLPKDLVEHITSTLHWGLEPSARFIVALLRLAGKKTLAEAVKREALREFAGSFKGMVLASGRLAMRIKRLMTSALPPVIQKVLGDVRFTRRKITVRVDNSFSMYSAGDDGAKGFTALVDIDTNQYDLVWGAFGGGALGQKPTPVDDVNTPKKPLPDHLVVVQGQIGGRDPYASLICTEKTFARLNTRGVRANMVEELRDKQASDRLTSRYMRAFNKFNAPELVSQLLTVLEQEGLKDALNQVKMKRIPELVEKAWSSRGK